MSDTAKILINIINIIFLSTGILISLGILILIFYHRHQYPINTSIVLIGNSYLFLIFSSIILLDICVHNLYGDLYGHISFNNLWCYIRGYLLHVILCSIYLSYLLQALFRLFRIVFYKYRRLQNFQFILVLILIQWLFAFLIISPVIFLHYVQYLPEVYYCHIPLTNLKGTIFVCVIVYDGPTFVTSIIYSYIMYYIRKRSTVSIQQNRQQSNQRDLIVLRRINILVGMLLVLILPVAVLWVNYVVTGYLSPIIYHMEWLTFSISLLILPIASAFLNPQLSQLISITCRQKRRVHPVLLIQLPATNNANAR